MSNSIAWMCDANDGANADATASERVRDDYARFGREITPLYAIPDTHRIVPAELLSRIMELAGVALVYQPFGTKDRQHFDTLMAIIEEKENKQ